MKKALTSTALATLLLVFIAGVAWLLRGDGPDDGPDEGGRAGDVEAPAEFAPRRHGDANPEPASQPDAEGTLTAAPTTASDRNESIAPVVLGRIWAGARGTPLASSAVRVCIERDGGTSKRVLKTGARGEFRIDGVGAEEVELTFEHDRFRPATVRGTPVSRQAAAGGVGGLEVLLVEGLELRGLVSDLRGQAAPDLLLEWSRADGDAQTREVRTDPAGRYEIGGLLEGSYLVRAVPAGLRQAWDGPPTHRVAVRQETEGRYDLTVDAGNTLPVVVRHADGQDAVGVEVRFLLKTRARGLSGVLPATDARGRTELRGLPHTGKLTLEIAPAGVGSAAAKTRAVLDIDLEQRPRQATLTLRG